MILNHFFFLFNHSIKVSLETPTCDKSNEKSMCSGALVHLAGSGSSIPGTGVIEPLQALPFIRSPDRDPRDAWRLLIHKIPK